jgi:hypothetical protein
MTRVKMVLRDLWQTFFVEPVRENAVRAHGGGATAASMVALGLVGFALAVVLVLLAPTIAATPVGPDTAVLANDAEPGLPVTIPLFFFPMFTVIALVSSFLGIFGAVYAPRALAAVSVLFVFVTTSMFAGFAWGFREVAWPAYVGLPATLAAPLVVAALRWRTPSPPTVQAVSCAVAILSVMPATWAVVDAFTTAGTSGGAALLAHQSETLVLLLGFLVSPAPVLAGAGAVSFGRTVTDFLARAVDVLTGRRHLAFVAAFLLLLVWRAAATTVEVVRADNAQALVVKALLLAIVFPAAAAWWAWATRGFDETPDEVEDGSAQGTGWVTVLLLFVFLLTGLVSVVAFLETAYFGSLHMVGVFNDVNELANREGVITTAMLGGGALLVAWAAWSARRTPSVLAAWLGVAGGVILLVVGWNNVLTDRGWVGLGAIDYAHATLLVVVVATVWRLVRWRSHGEAPSPGWTLTAFSAVALTALVAQGTFLEDPFRPLLGFTGLGLVFFGLVWGLLTAGAHASATGLAGLGRTAVLLSYAVLTTLLIAWSDVTSGAVDEALSGGFAVAGKNIIGGALLVALLAVWLPILFGLAEPAVREPAVEDPTKPQPDEPPRATLPV